MSNNIISFIQSRIDGGFTADWVPKTGWERANTYNPIDYACVSLGITPDKLKNKNRIKTIVRGECGKECCVIVRYDESYSDFEYVAFDQCTGDGTLYFPEQLKAQLAYKPMALATCSKCRQELLEEIINGDCTMDYNIEYILGPIAEHTEYGHFNNRGWLEMRTTVAMPVAMNISKAEDND